MSPKPEDLVLLLIDLQEPILARSKTNPAETIRRVAGAVVRAAAVLEIPVVLSAVPVGDESPAMIAELPGSRYVRTGTGALDDAPTLAAIRETGRRHLVIGGVLTEVAAISAVRGALREGFSVTLLIDLCGGISNRTEDAVFRTLAEWGIEILPVASFLAPYIVDFGAEPGKSLLPIVRETYV